MEFRYGFVGDSVELSARGKFSVLGGGIEYVTCTHLPWLMPMFFLAKLRVLPNERAATHVAVVQFIRPNDESVTATSAIGADPIDVPADRPADHLVIVTFNPMILHQEGVHRFVVSVGNDVLGEVAFHVDLIRTGSTGQAKEGQGTHDCGRSDP